MAGEVCELCHRKICLCPQIERFLDWLLVNPDLTLRDSILDPERCWQLINALRRRVLATATAERKRCAEYVRTYDVELADSLERLAENR
jgi:hypothetical protein